MTINRVALATSSRGITPQLSVSQRTLNDEDNQTLTLDAMKEETLRCANCGCVAVNCSDIATALSRVGCTGDNHANERWTPKIYLRLSKAGQRYWRDDELIKEIWIPAPEPENRQCYLKFRIRNSIDFPIVSVAFHATMRDGRFHDARVVLGAVGPVPLRARAVEDLLENQVLDEKLVKEAAVLAVCNAQPLARNKAQVQIVKASR